MTTVNKKPDHAILFLYEGDTEGGFYDRLFELYGLTRQVQIKKKCINGIYNINQKVADKIYGYLENAKNDHVKYLTVFVAYDREQARGEIDSRINIGLIIKQTADKRLKAIHEIIATQMLESWFFIDIDGIYSYLKMPASQREPHKYSNHEKYTADNLDELFKQKDKRSKYYKGAGCIDLIKHLDLMKIHDNCPDLKKGIDKLFQVAGIKRA